MLFSELTAEGWVLIIGALFFGIQQTVSMILEYTRNNAKIERDVAIDKKVNVATEKVEEKLDDIHKKVETVTEKVEEKLENISKVGEAVHTLVNSAMSEQKRMLVEVTKAKYNITRDPADKLAMEMAVLAYNEHEAKQAVVDAGINTPVAKDVKKNSPKDNNLWDGRNTESVEG